MEDKRPCYEGESAFENYKGSNGPESELQIAFLGWLRVTYPRVFWLTFSVPNDGLRSDEEFKRQMKLGLKAGVPDIFMAVPTLRAHGLFLELKVNNNKPSDNQTRMMSVFRGQGYRCEVPYTLGQLVTIVQDYLKDAKDARCRSVTLAYNPSDIDSDGFTFD